MKTKQLTTLMLLCAAMLATTGCGGDDGPAGEPEGPEDPGKVTVTHKLKAISFNIHTSNSNPWAPRKAAVVAMLKDQAPDMFGLQEARLDQITTLDEELTEYARVGIDRDDNPATGEFMSIYYLKEKFEKVSNGDFWLSETPDEPSYGWGASYRRIVTWIHLRDKETEKDIYYYNTHFDHSSETARMKSSELVVARMKALVPENAVVFLTGDLNMRLHVAQMAPLRACLSDAKTTAPITDNTHSFPGGDKTIDFILYRNIGIDSYGVVTGKYGHTSVLSDHYPITAVFSYETTETPAE